MDGIQVKTQLLLKKQWASLIPADPRAHLKPKGLSDSCVGIDTRLYLE